MTRVSKLLRNFCQKIYKETGGPTPALRQAYDSYTRQPKTCSVCAAKDAEIQRLREEVEDLSNALAAIVNRSYNNELGTNKVIDMRKIACAALDGDMRWY
jgi:1,2-phenylacetyl-CoA epoxidase PaaB subunit